MKKTRLLVTGSFIGLAMLAVQPAFAQTSDDDKSAQSDDQGDQSDEAEEEGANAPILVTGSRISRS